MFDHILWDGDAFARCYVDHNKVEPAIAADLFCAFIGDDEFYAAAFFVDGFDAGFYDEVIAHG